MGKKLFRREGKGIKPTEFGLMVFSHTQKMFETAQDLMEQLSKRGEPKGELLKIGVSDDLERSWINEVIDQIVSGAGFEKNILPQATYISGPHEALETKLRKGNLDVVFSFSGVEEGDLMILEEFEIPVMLGVPSSYSLSDAEIVALAENNLESVFLRDGWGLAVPSRSFRLRAETEKFLKASKLTPRLVFEGEVLSAVTLAVETQKGAAFLPMPYMIKGINEGALRAYGPPQGFWRHKVFLLARKDDSQKPIQMSLKNGLAHLNHTGLTAEKISA